MTFCGVIVLCRQTYYTGRHDFIYSLKSIKMFRRGFFFHFKFLNTNVTPFCFIQIDTCVFSFTFICNCVISHSLSDLSLTCRINFHKL